MNEGDRIKRILSVLFLLIAEELQRALNHTKCDNVKKKNHYINGGQQGENESSVKITVT